MEMTLNNHSQITIIIHHSNIDIIKKNEVDFLKSIIQNQLMDPKKLEVDDMEKKKIFLDNCFKKNLNVDLSLEISDKSFEFNKFLTIDNKEYLFVNQSAENESNQKMFFGWTSTCQLQTSETESRLTLDIFELETTEKFIKFFTMEKSLFMLTNQGIYEIRNYDSDEEKTLKKIFHIQDKEDHEKFEIYETKKFNEKSILYLHLKPIDEQVNETLFVYIDYRFEEIQSTSEKRISKSFDSFELDQKNKKFIFAFEKKSSSIHKLNFSNQEDLLNEKSLQKSVFMMIKDQKSENSILKFDENLKFFFTNGENSIKINKYSFESRKLVDSFEHDNTVKEIVFINQDIFATKDAKNFIYFWSLKTSKIISKIYHKCFIEYRKIEVINTQDEFVLNVYQQNFLKKFDLRNSSTKNKKLMIESEQNQFFISPNKKYLSLLSDNSFYKLNLNHNFKIEKVLKMNKIGINDQSFSQIIDENKIIYHQILLNESEEIICNRIFLLDLKNINLNEGNNLKTNEEKNKYKNLTVCFPSSENSETLSDLTFEDINISNEGKNFNSKLQHNGFLLFQSENEIAINFEIIKNKVGFYEHDYELFVSTDYGNGCLIKFNIDESLKSIAGVKINLNSNISKTLKNTSDLFKNNVDSINVNIFENYQRLKTNDVFFFETKKKLKIFDVMKKFEKLDLSIVLSSEFLLQSLEKKNSNEFMNMDLTQNVILIENENKIISQKIAIGDISYKKSQDSDQIDNFALLDFYSNHFQIEYIKTLGNVHYFYFITHDNIVVLMNFDFVTKNLSLEKRIRIYHSKNFNFYSKELDVFFVAGRHKLNIWNSSFTKVIHSIFLKNEITNIVIKETEHFSRFIVYTENDYNEYDCKTFQQVRNVVFEEENSILVDKEHFSPNVVFKFYSFISNLRFSNPVESFSSTEFPEYQITNCLYHTEYESYIKDFAEYYFEQLEKNNHIDNIYGPMNPYILAIYKNDMNLLEDLLNKYRYPRSFQGYISPIQYAFLKKRTLAIKLICDYLIKRDYYVEFNEFEYEYLLKSNLDHAHTLLSTILNENCLEHFPRLVDMQSRNLMIKYDHSQTNILEEIRKTDIETSKKDSGNKEETFHYFIPFKYNFNEGSPDSLNLLYYYSESPSEEFLLSEWKEIINDKWEKQNKKFVAIAIFYWIFTIINTLTMVFYPHRIYLQCLSIFYTFLIIIKETIEVFSYSSFKIGRYYQNIWNYVDWGVNILLVVYYFMVIIFEVNPNTIKINAVTIDVQDGFQYKFDIAENVISSVLLLFIYYRSFTYLVIFEKFTNLIGIINAVVTKLVYFIFIIFYMYLVTALVLIKLSNADEDRNIKGLFQSAYIWIMFGGVAPDDFAKFSFTGIPIVFGTVVVTVILLNLLIAYLSNEFSRLEEQQNINQMKEKASILLDLEVIIYWFRYRISGDMKFYEKYKELLEAKSMNFETLKETKSENFDKMNFFEKKETLQKVNTQTNEDLLNKLEDYYKLFDSKNNKKKIFEKLISNQLKNTQKNMKLMNTDLYELEKYMHQIIEDKKYFIILKNANFDDNEREEQSMEDNFYKRVKNMNKDITFLKDEMMKKITFLENIVGDEINTKITQVYEEMNNKNYSVEKKWNILRESFKNQKKSLNSQYDNMNKDLNQMKEDIQTDLQSQTELLNQKLAEQEKKNEEILEILKSLKR